MLFPKFVSCVENPVKGPHPLSEYYARMHDFSHLGIEKHFTLSFALQKQLNVGK